MINTTVENIVVYASVIFVDAPTDTELADDVSVWCDSLLVDARSVACCTKRVCARASIDIPADTQHRR
jgi:hypothetical protein